MKYKYVYLLIFLVFSCRSESPKSKNTIKWNKKTIGHFVIDFPSNYRIKYQSTDSNRGVISNGHINLDFTKAYLVPSSFDAGETVKEINKGSLKGKMLFFSNGINKGETVICYWDSIRLTNLFSGSTRYSGIILIGRNINSKEHDTLNKIFNSIRENK